MPVQCTCIGCGDEFFVPPSVSTTRKWCTAACRYSTPDWGTVLHVGHRKSCICKTCGHRFTVQLTAVGNCCSRACANKSAENRGRIDLTKWAVFTCLTCGEHYVRYRSVAHRTRFCTRSCCARWIVQNQQRNRTTLIERLLREALLAVGLTPEVEHGVGPYSIDLALPGQMVAIEADGTYWHSLEPRKRLDAQKDAYLTDAGWVVLRFTEKQIKANAVRCASVVQVVIGQ